MKIDLPATLNAHVETVYPDNMNWADRSIHPLHEVVVTFGGEVIVRVPCTPEQVSRIDYHSQWNDETLVEIATETVAGMLRKMWKT